MRAFLSILFLSAVVVIFTPNFVQADVPVVPSCCSSVVFLPGLEGSRLYAPGFLVEDRLWEPFTNADVEDLMLQADGTSVDSRIYTRDVIDNIYGGFGAIYGPFMQTMDALVASGTIAAWKSLPYDWRFQLDDLLASGWQSGNNISYIGPSLQPYLLKQVSNLAETSQTGKVTLIAHSNGGLLAKKLVDKLVEEGDEDLIDKIILVAVPQSGTPQAIAAMLHGTGEERGFGFIVSAATARTLAENMPAVYNLIPFGSYFSAVLDPVITFDASSTILAPYRAAYGGAIDSASELRSFLLGAEGRTKPAANDLDTPNILNTYLMNRASSTQQSLDAWQAPLGVEVYQIAGWGLDTLAGIRYTERTESDCGVPFICPPQKVIDLRPELVVDGDRTVLSPSALRSFINSYYFDLRTYNTENSKNDGHAQILSTQPILLQLQKLLSNDDLFLAKYLRTTKPDSKPEDRTLRVSVHSPVSLNLYDSSGRHTGVATSTGGVALIDEQIPNSYYFELGEGKYAGVDGEAPTNIHLVGQGTGLFTLEIEQATGDTPTASAVFTDVPVIAGAQISTSIQNPAAQPPLLVDIDGDGTTDASIAPSANGISAKELIGILRGVIRTLSFEAKRKQHLERLLTTIERVLDREGRNEQRKKQHLASTFRHLTTLINRYEKRFNIPRGDVVQLLTVIQQIKNKLSIK